MNKMIRTALVLALFACASLVLVSPTRAQSVYGSIFGTVTDKSGAAVPGATITVTDESKGTVVNVTSNGSGDYSVPHLIPDVYDLKVTSKGFKAFETKGIQVEADAAPRIDPMMDVGGASETVEVNADQEPELKTDRADVATTFDAQQIESLPVGDQNFTNLQLLLPGAQILGWSHAADENPQGSKQIQVDGQAFGGTAFELDGTDNEDPILGIIVINPAMDSVTDTKITTQNYDAELGKAVSAVVTAQTKSGTNSFHGSAYDFRTGNANLARDPYNQPTGSIPPGLKNRMGASIGGPILRNKAFFFFNYEGQRQKVGTSATDTLPTAFTTATCLGTTPDSQGGNGCDFSQYLAAKGASAQIYDNSSGVPVPYANNIIPRAEVSTAAAAPALKLLSILAPYTAGITAIDSNFNESGTGLFNSNQWTERVDYTLSEKASIFERFSRFTDVLSGAVMFGAAGGPGFGIGNYGGNSTGANDSLAIGADYAFSPKLLTDFRLGYYRYNIIDVKHDQGTEFANTLGIPGINIGGTITSGSPGFSITNVPGGAGGTQGNPVFGDGLSINRCNCPLTEREDQFQIVNNWTKVAGNHTFKAGLDLRYGRNLRVPSDNDRAGLLNFNNNATSDPGAPGGVQGGLGFATFMLGEVTSFNRYVSVSTNAKEFQKRTFSYVQDTWRASPKLTFNLGVRWDMYFPETVNAAGNGALMNINDGYLHVAGIGGNPSDMGWTVKALKQFSPRLGITYQWDPKTVIRTGYGRSFDTGVFGSTFGHTVTQNLPVLANQQINQASNTVPAFDLNVGPTPYVFPSVPSNGLLPNPGYTGGVDSKVRPNPMHLTTIDAWNLAVERAITPTMSLTVAYVGNKGTHTLGDGDSNSTNPNEEAVALPGNYSVTGQTLHWAPSTPQDATAGGAYPGVSTTGGTDIGHLLTRYYGGSLPACTDPNYISLAGLRAADGDPNLAAGSCGWTNGIQLNGDDQNTEFDALQITINQAMWHGLSYGANYQWASAFADSSDYWTWSHSIPHLRDSNVRNQQMTWYGSYDLPFGKGRQFAGSANHLEDLLIGGYQLSAVVNISGGLPFTWSYNGSGSNVPNGPSDPSMVKGASFHTGLSSPTFVANPNGPGGTITRSYFNAPGVIGEACTTGASCVNGFVANSPFVNPGLDNFGNAGQNTVRGPGFWNTDMAVSKNFAIWEKVAIKFRMDAFNAFNHINAGNPNGNVDNGGSITSGGQGYGQSQDFGPRQLEFSLHLQF